jgi:hypothetical protein
MKARLLLCLALLSAVGCPFLPEDTDEKRDTENIPPRIWITSGATEGASGVDYRAAFEWLGADEDGIVRRYQYSIDDTTTSEAWIDTTATRVRLTLSASQPGWYASEDTLGEWHTFFVRAIDNEGGISTPESRHFNTRTIAPSTRITYPYVTSGSITVDDCVFVTWEGEDLDASNPEQRPESYECKLIRIAHPYIEEEAIVDSIHHKVNLLRDPSAPGDSAGWILLPGEVEEYELTDFEGPGNTTYVFCIRAVDEAGAIEPRLERGENWFSFHPHNIRRPRVTVAVYGFGSHTFPDDGSVWEIHFPTEVPLSFEWTGEPPIEFADYGWDIPDPYDDSYRDPHGIGGYIGWSATDRTRSPRTFPSVEDGQSHVFTLRTRTRGCGEHEVYSTVLVHVIDWPGAPTALLVDDAKINYGIHQDEIHDEFITRFTGRILDFLDLDRSSLYRPRNTDPEGRNPNESTIMTLVELMAYEAVLWSFNYAGGPSTGIWYHEHEGRFDDRRLLSSYVALGGKLFLFGNMPVSSIISMHDGGFPTRDYPKAPPQAGYESATYSTESFVWQFLHVRSRIVGIDPFDCYGRPPNEHQAYRDGLIRCSSRNPAYPDLDLDPSKHDADLPIGDCPQIPSPPLGGLRDWEGVLHHGGLPPLDPEPGLDTLYTSVPYGWSGGLPPAFRDAVIAQRYESTAADTLAERAQGRVVLFLFQPFYFTEGPAHDAGTAAINWLMTGSDY